MNYLAGPKYVHFWSRKFDIHVAFFLAIDRMIVLAVMKSSLVAAGLGDLMRPADKLSLNQSISLAATGLIWSRVITPPPLPFPLRSLARLYLVLYGHHTKELFPWSR